MFGLGPRILKKGQAKRVIFYGSGDDDTYIDQVDVTIFENGIVNIRGRTEETTTHLQNCEIQWWFESPSDDRKGILRLIREPDRDNDRDTDRDIDRDGDFEPHSPRTDS